MSASTRRWQSIGMLLTAVIVLASACKKVSPEQAAALQARAMDQAQEPSSAAAEARSRSAMLTAGWANLPQASQAYIQDVVISGYLQNACKTAWRVTGSLPQSVSDLAAAGTLLIAPVGQDGEALPYVDGPAATGGVRLSWSPASVEFETHGRRADPANAALVPSGAIDLLSFHTQRQVDLQIRANLGLAEQQRTSTRRQQDLLADAQASCLLLFSTHHERFPQDLDELYAFADIKPIAAGQPLAEGAMPGVGGMLLEANDAEHRIRWRVIQEDHSFRWIQGMRFDDHFQPKPTQKGEPLRSLEPADHLSTEGWRTLAAFQF